MKKVALFGGGFDPIHFGHINLALEMKEKHKLDVIYFCPAYVSPHKVDRPPKASCEDRLKMVKLVTDQIDGFEVYDFEIRKKEPSYTVDTLKSLEGDLYLILSQEALKGFNSWKDPDEVLKLAKPLIGRRGLDDLDFSGPYGDSFKKGMTQTKIFEISSTEIRERLQKKLCCFHLLPKVVLDYIYQHDLY